ncbi:hypothetical protein CERSUDRAFT_55817 [Gelatoporia subvermispora B]|uniref:Xaa-Pro dipeptidyl-peptidase-like domain-containing protein n=1 Tax=Ceriporiopsis subvermispora (strain B) TaxID=914234 RepID=M2R6R0_CERS8|nr:hypothetical protein CERSUDRAFT_55817 [Gelatoporia subvermispora B]
MPSRQVNRSDTRDVVQLPCGTTLEYILSSPELATPSETPREAVASKLAICLHPWSWLGGRMEDPVLQLLSAPLEEKGYHVLRYNSRGVGKSTGWPSLTGSREVQDLRELIQWALDTIPTTTSVVIIGYSYGSLIASCIPVHPDVQTSHILLSYPIGPRHWLTAFHGRSYAAALRGLVRDPRSNVLIVYGDRDDFTSSDVYDTWMNGIVADAKGSEGHLEVTQIEGATHFWREEAPHSHLIALLSRWIP